MEETVKEVKQMCLRTGTARKAKFYKKSDNENCLKKKKK